VILPSWEKTFWILPSTPAYSPLTSLTLSPGLTRTELLVYFAFRSVDSMALESLRPFSRVELFASFFLTFTGFEEPTEIFNKNQLTVSNNHRCQIGNPRPSFRSFSGYRAFDIRALEIAFWRDDHSCVVLEHDPLAADSPYGIFLTNYHGSEGLLSQFRGASFNHDSNMISHGGSRDSFQSPVISSHINNAQRFRASVVSTCNYGI
jgi:hypothetical protein